MRGEGADRLRQRLRGIPTRAPALDLAADPPNVVPRHAEERQRGRQGPADQGRIGLPQARGRGQLLLRRRSAPAGDAEPRQGQVGRALVRAGGEAGAEPGELLGHRSETDPQCRSGLESARSRRRPFSPALAFPRLGAAAGSPCPCAPSRTGPARRGATVPGNFRRINVSALAESSSRTARSNMGHIGQMNFGSTSRTRS